MILILPSQATVLNAYAVLVGMTPGYAAFKDHQAYIAASSTAAYKTALEGLFAATSTASLATTMLTNLGLSTTFTQAQGEAFLAANPGNRVGAMIDLASALYVYSGTDAGLTAAKAAYVNAVDTSYAYSNNSLNINGQAWVGTGGQTVSLTTGFDNVMGTALSDTFLARTIGNANTLNDRDMVDGGAGNDTLFVDFTSLGNAITPVLKNIETVVIRAQTTTADATNGNNLTNATVQLDAQRSLAVDNYDHVTAATGVTRWESNNSRSDVIIEDVRIGNSQKTKDITIAMVETDPGNVDFGVYFDQLSLRNSATSNTTINIQLMDTGAAAGYNGADTTKPLLNNPYDTFKFLLNGVQVSINLNPAGSTTVASSADTYAQLLAAFQVALVGTGVTASLGANFSLADPLTTNTVTGQTIVLTGGGAAISTNALSGWYNTLQTPVPADANIYNKFTTGASSVSELVTSTVVLDDVGRGSTGGDLVIGGLSVGESSTSRGVERFEITVNDNSKLQTINSTNNSLREVTIVNGTTSNTVVDAYTATTTNSGNLTVNGNAKSSLGVDQGDDTPVGNATGNQTMAGVNEGSTQGATDPHQGANADGFTDVRLIDGSAMTGKLAFTAAITTDSIAKYVNRTDTAVSPTADVAGTGNVNFSATAPNNGANFIYNGGANNDTMVVNIDGAATASRSTIVSGLHDMTFALDGGAGNDTITVDLISTANAPVGGIESWANNQDLNNNITITGGAGDDTIRTPGAGDIVIDAGAGNDGVFTDNTGRQTITATTGAIGIATGTTSANAMWVFNTWDQVNAVANGAARNINDLRSDASDSYNFYKGTVTVAFKGIPATAITLANATTYKTSDLEINQAIKQAINTDATLSKLLVAQDGPGNTLVVTSLIDGTMAAADLTVTFAAAVASTVYSSAEIAGMATAYSNAAITTNALALAAQVLPSSKAIGSDYVAKFATDGAADIVGAPSTSTSDNFVSPGTGNDVIVLGTTVGVDVARSSNEVVTLAAGFGNDVIVNFAATGFGADHLNVGAFLTSTVATTVGGLANTNSLVTVVAEVATTNDTLTLVTAIIKAAIDTAVQATATKQVYIVYNAHNVGSVYSVVNGTAASDAVVTLEGTIDLADTLWATLTTAANFSTVSATAEGASSAAVAALLTAVINNQVLVGTTGIDTLNTAGFTGVTMTGGASADLFQVAAAGAIITDLASGDAIVRTAGAVTAGATAAVGVSAFVATAATTTNGAPANVVITSLTAGSTIDMSLAGVTTATTDGYTLNGGAGNDTLTGSAGVDALNSGATGTDVLNGGAGNDTLTAQGGTVTLNGGAGNDTIVAAAGADTVNVTSGVDAITAFGTGADVITVSAGAAANVTTNANWTALATSSNAGVLNITIGGGTTLDLSAMTGSVGVNVTDQTGVADVITGTILADSITTLAGAFADTIKGGAGADTITLGVDATTDLIVISSAASADTIASGFLAGAGGDTFQFDFSDLVTTGGLLLKDGGSAAIGAATVSLLKAIPAATPTTVAAADTIFAMGSTFASSAALETAIEAGGASAITLGAASTAGDDYLVLWSDGTNSHVGFYNAGTAATTFAASGTYTELATLTGVAAVAAYVSANFAMIA